VKPIRVLLLTQWFDPEPSFKGLTFARELKRQGLDVQVVTGFPNYPGGKLYPGYKIKLIQNEVIDGIKITRVPLYPSHNRSAIKRAINYISFSFSSFIYCLFFMRGVDVIYAYHPPLTVGIAAVLIKILRRIPVVYDVQDLWPDTLSTTGMLKNDKILLAIGSLCMVVYKLVERIVVLSPGFKKKLIERGVDEKKIEVIYNWADEEKINNIDEFFSYKLKKDNNFCLLFAGNIGLAQALESVLEAAELIKIKGINAKIIFIGAGLELENIKRLAFTKQITNVEFIPPVPMHKIGQILKSADALLVHLKSDELFKITIPSKTQAYMASAKPILMAVEGDAAHLVLQANCGNFARMEDPKSIAQAIEELARMDSKELKEMGERGLDYYNQNLSISVGVEKFRNIFSAVLYDEIK
jgi:glycosyltransferase involved in cell wall biosynthesis